MVSIIRESDISIFAKADARGSNTPFGIKQADRRGHMYIIGKTGTGKSTLLEGIAVLSGFDTAIWETGCEFGSRLDEPRKGKLRRTRSARRSSEADPVPHTGRVGRPRD